VPKLPRVSGAKIIQALKRLGFLQVRQRGSHVVLRKETADGVVGCVVPMHKGVAVGTLRSVLRQADVNPDEFLEALRGG
jgi:predicted RNA binding protein YcfA (HicA-like mRNA interferase family)